VITGLSGCTSEQTVQPVMPTTPHQLPPALEVWVNGGRIACFDRPDAVASLFESLAEEEQALLLAEGSCVARDSRFRLAILDLLPEAPGVRGGFSGHIRDVSWGEIKVVLAGRRG
jgi:hypothetical protein